MTRLAQSEELELEPLLIANGGPSNEDDMSVMSINRGYDDDKDTEKIDQRPPESLASTSLEDAAFEKRLVRKLDKRILPIVCILYLFACKSSMYASS